MTEPKDDDELEVEAEETEEEQDGSEPDLEAEAKAEDAVESASIPGGVQTTDPTFADGAMEVNQVPWNPPSE